MKSFFKSADQQVGPDREHDRPALSVEVSSGEVRQEPLHFIPEVDGPRLASQCYMSVLVVKNGG